MKVDFNHRIGPDPRGGALSAYHALWYELVDTLRGRHPQCVFEGCASGGMRLDLESTRHFETHFLSDNVEPIESLRIFEGAVLRSLPGRIGRWSCLRACEGIPTYARKAEDAAPRVAHAGGATWEPFVETSPVFAARMAMCGAWGLSGDLASLADRQIDQLAGCAAFYKRWRRFIAGSAFTPLTAAMPIHRRDGFSAFLLRPPGGEASLVFAYGLERDVPPRVQLPLTGLDAGREYTVEDPDEADAEPLRLPGRRLAEDGLEIALAPRTARIRILRPA
jgi:alpha-galactosidase